MVGNTINDKKIITKYLVPFSYDSGCKRDTYTSFFDNGWGIKSMYQDNEFFTYIEQLVASSSSSNSNFIGVVLSKHNENLRLVSDDENLLLNDFELYIFDTGIAFLVLDIYRPSGPLVDNVINSNHNVKSISHNQFKILKQYERTCPYMDSLIEIDGVECFNTNSRKKVYIQSDVFSDLDRTSKPKIISRNGISEIIYQSNVTIDFRVFVDELLKPFRNKKYFLSERYSKSKEISFSSKANVFNYMLVDTNDDIKGLAYLLGHGYKSSYKKTEFSNSDFTFNTFTNSAWSVSKEGLSNVVSLTDDLVTNTFFSNLYLKRLDNYFFLYVLALHQYYSLIHISERISKLPSSIQDYSIDHESYDKLIQQYDEVNFIYLRCIFHEVTHISHQNDVYKKLFEKLGIDKLLSEVNFEMDRLANIANILRMDIQQSEFKLKEEEFRLLQKNWREEEKTEKLRNENKMKFEKWITIVGSSLAFFAIFEAIWNMVRIVDVTNIKVLTILQFDLLKEIVVVLAIIVAWLIIIISTYKLWHKRVDK